MITSAVVEHFDNFDESICFWVDIVGVSEELMLQAKQIDKEILMKNVLVVVFFWIRTVGVLSTKGNVKYIMLITMEKNIGWNPNLTNKKSIQ